MKPKDESITAALRRDEGLRTEFKNLVLAGADEPTQIRWIKSMGYFAPTSTRHLKIEHGLRAKPGGKRPPPGSRAPSPLNVGRNHA